jgi:hypothetical protein
MVASCSFDPGYDEIIGNGFRFARPEFPLWNVLTPLRRNP